jgi:antitoxin component YwqK of YwqJK toxin-antitoxin module
VKELVTSLTIAEEVKRAIDKLRAFNSLFERTFYYDENGNLIKIVIKDKNSGRAKQIVFTYDENGNILKIDETLI